jgi:tetratricopeptide (TPR) repeat protein
VWGIAWVALGSGIGFLFGLPKVNDAADQTAAAKRNLNVNKNIQEISDWLTKIIVGVGLVELKQIPKTLKRAATYFASSFPADASPAPFVIGISSSLFFSIFGFLTTYVAMRLYLTGAMSEADSATDALTIMKNAPLTAGPQDRVAGTTDDTPVTPEQKEQQRQQSQAVQSVITLPLESLKTPEDQSAWAKAQRQAGNIDKALQGYELALKKAPDDPSIRYEYAMALGETWAEPARIYEELLKAMKALTARSDRTLAKAIYEALTFYALYIEPPRGYQEVITHGEAYRAMPASIPSGRIYVNLAAAYGQAAKDAKAKGDGEQFEKARQAALQNVKAAIAMGDGWKLLLQTLWTPASIQPKDPSEDDLEVFYDDDEFKKVLG